MHKLLFIIGLMLVMPASSEVISLEKIIDSTLRQHPELKGAESLLIAEKAAKLGVFNLPDPELLFESPTGDFFTIGVQQSFDNPIMYWRGLQIANQEVRLAKVNIVMTKYKIIKKVSKLYVQYQYAYESYYQLLRLDSLFNQNIKNVEERFNAGDIGLLEKTTIQLQYEDFRFKLREARNRLNLTVVELEMLSGLNLNAYFPEPLKQVQINRPSQYSSPSTMYWEESVNLSKLELKHARSQVLPKFSLGYMNQAEKNSNFIPRLQFGISIPLWAWTHQSRIKEAKAFHQVAEYKKMEFAMNWQTKAIDYSSHLELLNSRLVYFQSTGLPQANTLIKAAQKSWMAGEINYLEFTLHFKQALEIKETYFKVLRDYNLTVLDFNYLTGNLL